MQLQTYFEHLKIWKDMCKCLYLYLYKRFVYCCFKVIIYALCQLDMNIYNRWNSHITYYILSSLLQPETLSTQLFKFYFYKQLQVIWLNNYFSYQIGSVSLKVLLNFILICNKSIQNTSWRFLVHICRDQVNWMAKISNANFRGNIHCVYRYILVVFYL